jgi:hypothetical protein
LTYVLSRRSTAAVSLTHAASRSNGLLPATSVLGGLRFEHRLSASGVVHAGYGFGTASFATAEAGAGRRHDIDLGVDYARPLPFSGRTVFAAGTSSTILSDGQTERLRIGGYGRLTRELGRWTSALEYERPMQFVAGFDQPFLSDTISAHADGQVGRTWFTSVGSGVSRGSVGFGPGRGVYTSLAGTLRVRHSIARAWHVEAEAYATRFHFGDAAIPAVPLPARLSRQGLRVGFSWSTRGRK